jgi:hypothetical protein
VDFHPHYLIWVCQPGSNQEECDSQCIANGAYCCPDPDDDISRGYAGRDVLRVGAFAGGGGGLAIGRLFWVGRGCLFCLLGVKGLSAWSQPARQGRRASWTLDGGVSQGF